MTLSPRFFGRKDADDRAGGQLEANPDIKHPLSLQVLFPDALDTDQLVGALRSYHRSMSEAQCEVYLSPEGEVFMGMLGWGKHVIRLLGFGAPYPAAPFEACVAASHYTQELKQRARSHKAHVNLYYVG